jgi:DNA polymerase-1
MSSPKKPKLFLIDGSALAYRSYFAFIKNPLSNSKGEITSTAYGFTRVLMQILDVEKPDYFAVVFDTPKPTFRHELYQAYKGTRQKMPVEMADTLPRVREIIEAFNIPILEIPGYEADDIIGTLAKMAEGAGLHSFLMTGDKDFMQLVTPNTWIYNFKKGSDEPEITDSAGVVAKMGVPPERIIDLLSLMGDSSDNVPGAKGIGPVMAKKLIHQFGSVEKILAGVDQISANVARESLQENRALVELSKALVTIQTNVPLGLELEALKSQEGNSEKLLSLFKELEFKGFTERFTTKTLPVQIDYRILKTINEVETLVQDLRNAGAFTLDLETTALDPLLAEIVGFSFCYQSGLAYYIPVKSSPLTGTTESLFSTENKAISLDVAAVLKRLRPLLEDPTLKKCGQNIKYDLLVLSNYDLQVQGVTFDTMVASYVLNPEGRQHNLDSLALEYFDYTKVPTSDLIGKGKNQITMAEVPVEKVGFYACEDADMTQRLKEKFEPLLHQNELIELFENIEMPLVDVLLEIERVGVSIDAKFLAEMAVRFDEEMLIILKEIEYQAGARINLNSPKQLSDLLFNKLKLPPARRTKTGYSTDVTVLETLAKHHDLPRKIVDYRQLSKLQSTYVTALPKMINPRTRRIHTSYNQTVTVTGRLSSSDPNLQNIPIRTEQGREIRRAFVPKDAQHVFVDADYSQIELRIMAHLSKDETLMNSFLQDEDIHLRTAALILNLPPAEVTSEQRRQAKAINFGIIYGMGAFGLASRLDISQAEAQSFINEYFLKYPGVKKYMDACIQEARKKGYVITLLGRRRRLPEILSDNRQRREFAERTAINTPIQGTAADLIKIAMINLHHRIQREKLATRMIMQVHDELVFEVPLSELETAKKMIGEEMEGAIKLDVPIKADLGVGKNWLEAH